MGFVLVLVGCVVILIQNCQSIQEWNATISSSTEFTFNYFWNQCVGSGHGSLALREDWQQQLKYAHDHVGVTSVRFHGILDDDVGSVNGINDYSFINIDNIFDYLLSIDMKPYVEISYMPNDFASGTDTAHHYKGDITLPKSWPTWYNFIATWMKHLIDRYSIDTVSQWKFEVWNEPNCGDFVAKGGGCNCSLNRFDDYISLYSNTSRAMKSVNSKLQVGGPATAKLCWIEEFINITQKQSIPLDFVSSHLYPSSNIVNASEGVNGFYSSLETAGDILNKYNDLNLTLYLSEFNSGLYGKTVGNHDNNFASAFMIFHAAKLQSLINKHNYGWLSYWTFSDIFEEGGFGSKPFHNEFGMQTIRGIVKPVLRALQLLYELGSTTAYNTTRTDGNNDDGTIQVYTLKNSNDTNRYGVYIANWNLNGQPIQDETLLVQVQQKGIPKKATLYRIDENNVNPVTKWNSMGSPTYPTQQQLQALNDASQFVTQSIGFTNVNANTVQFNVTVPSYGVVVIDLQY